MDIYFTREHGNDKLVYSLVRRQRVQKTVYFILFAMQAPVNMYVRCKINRIRIVYLAYSQKSSFVCMFEIILLYS